MNITDLPSMQQLLDENNRLKNILKKIKFEKGFQSIESQTFQEEEPQELYHDQIEANKQKIALLKETITSQKLVLGSYKQTIDRVQKNLQEVMKLDKDIHSKLVKPLPSAALEKNLVNLMLAINTNASSQTVVRMIEAIKI